MVFNYYYRGYTRKVKYPIRKNEHTYEQKSNEGIRKNEHTPIRKNVKENNTIINNTINNKKRKREKTEFDELIDEYTENTDLKNALYEFIKMRKGNRAVDIYGIKIDMNNCHTQPLCEFF